MKTSLPAIFLLCILLAPTLALYSWLQAKKITVRREVKQLLEVGLPESKLTTLVFSVRDAERHLRWEHENEFEYRGQMYDIASRESRGDSIVFKVWPDHAETALNKSLAKLATGTPDFPGKSQPSTDQVFRFFKTLYFHATLPAQAVFRQNQSGKVPHSEFMPAGKTLSPPSPPPKLC